MVTAAISIILGAIISYFIAKWQMKKNEITHFSLNSFDVGKGLHNDFPEFKLTYEGKELSDEVLVLKGGFINTGRNDITGLKNKSDINIILPEGCSLKKIIIKKSNDELEVNAQKNENAPNIIDFCIDEKLMSGEGFEYTALIETTKEIKNLHRHIDFKHRIANTSKIRNEFLGQQIQKCNKKNFFLSSLENGLAVGLTTFFGSVILGILAVYIYNFQPVTCSIKERGTNKDVSIYITPKSQFYVSKSDFPLFDKKEITKKEIDSNYYISSNMDYSMSKEQKFSLYFPAIAALVYLLVSVYYLYYMWYRKYRKNRIYLLLKQYEQQ